MGDSLVATVVAQRVASQLKREETRDELLTLKELLGGSLSAGSNSNTTNTDKAETNKELLGIHVRDHRVRITEAIDLYKEIVGKPKSIKEVRDWCTKNNIEIL